LKKGFEWIYSFLTSRELAIGLFGIICLFALTGTFLEKEGFYSNPLFITMIGLMGLNIFLCTIKRKNALAWPIVILHTGIILTLAGSVVSSFGFVSTVNIYEGTTVDKVYRWDLKKDVSLGMELALKKINMEYYPVPVKVGVLRHGEKVGLFILKTGESFTLDNYEIRVEILELPSENLILNVFDQGYLIGSADTSGERDLPPDFPYDFVLVAYKDPHLKRMWIELALLHGSDVIAEGTSEVNSPFIWKNLRFYHVQTAQDQYGFRYAGIQIRKDPGRLFAFFGFGVIGLGSVLYFISKVYGFR
jgi:hypothetical protein